MAKEVKRIIVRGHRRQPDIEKLARTLLKQVLARQSALSHSLPEAPPTSEEAAS